MNPSYHLKMGTHPLVSLFHHFIDVLPIAHMHMAACGQVSLRNAAQAKGEVDSGSITDVFYYELNSSTPVSAWKPCLPIF